MLKKAIISLLISCLIISPVFAKASSNSFNVKVEYIYTEGDKMIISWDEGKEKHTVFPVKEDPINLPNYYKAGESYPASNPTTQMRVYDNSNDPHLFNLDANPGTAQAVPTTTQATPSHSAKYYEAQQQNDDTALYAFVTIGCVVVLFLVVGWLYNGKSN
jgi:hypothetical protein